MLTAKEPFGKASIALAILGIIIPFVLMYLIPSMKDTVWINGIFVIILIELMAFIFGIVGWSSKYAKIGFALSILVTAASLAYFLPSFNGKDLQIKAISQ
jgi:hypothetical protein